MDTLCHHHDPLRHPLPHLCALGILRSRKMTTVSQTAPAIREETASSSHRRRSILHVLGEIAKYSILIILTVTWAFPLFWTITSALKDDPQIYTVPSVWIPNPAHWNNFVDGWTRNNFSLAAFNSFFRYALLVTVLTVVSSSQVAYGFSRIKWRGREVFFWVCI